MHSAQHPATRFPLHVHYCHGLESGPDGYKARSMRTRYAQLTAPDMQMSLWNPRARNAVVRHLMRRIPTTPPVWWLAGAFEDAMNACIDIQRRALNAPDVLVGSSWGAAVAASLLALGPWRGPTVLLCPALRQIERWMYPRGPLPSSAITAAGVAERLASLPKTVKARCLIVHGTRDRVVPLEDSRWLSQRSGIRLMEIQGGSHGLGAMVTEGQLYTFVEHVADFKTAPQP